MGLLLGSDSERLPQCVTKRITSSAFFRAVKDGLQHLTFINTVQHTALSIVKYSYLLEEAADANSQLQTGKLIARG